jgi:hypothetical protein
MAMPSVLAAGIVVGTGVATVLCALARLPVAWWFLVVFGLALGVLGFLLRQSWSFVVTMGGIALLTVGVLGGTGLLRLPTSPSGDGSSTGEGNGADSSASASPSGNAPYHVTITQPKSGSKVGRCAKFVGTSDVPAGKTLVFAVGNLTGSYRTRFVAPMWEWDNADLAPESWYVELYFGTQPGQAYSVDVLLADVTTVRKAEDGLGKNQYWTYDKRPASLTPLTTLQVVRKDGAGDCGA